MDKDEALRMALEALENNRQTHNYCEDTWYSCPKHEDGCANDSEGDECNCGADNVNAQFDKAIIAIKEALAQPDDLTIAYLSGVYDGKNKYAPQRKPEQAPVAWLTKELMANYLDTIAEAIEANRSEMLRHKAHKLRDRGEI